MTLHSIGHGKKSNLAQLLVPKNNPI